MDDKANKMMVEIAKLRRREQHEVPPWRDLERRLDVLDNNPKFLLRQAGREAPQTTHNSND
ncbi:uncharacterized protein DS421_15g510180 [Arachis hypogaea]|nr:uncharacterized protein DS421_15g510180 [Arachis hypogaea]